MKTSGKVVGHHSCIGMLIVFVFFWGGIRSGGVKIASMACCMSLF